MKNFLWVCIVLGIMAIFGSITLYSLNFDDSEKTWVATRLVQCHYNPWEKQSITVSQYYKSYGVTIYDSSSKEIHGEVHEGVQEGVLVTMGCSTASTTMMFLLVSNNNVDKMQNLGYIVIQNVTATESISAQYTPK